MSRDYHPSEESVRGYYRSLSLEAVNNRRKDRGLKALPRLGGFSYNEQRSYKIINDEHYGWVNDGKAWFYLDKGRVLM